jgi:DNA-binding NarL/FixJ family response regulator
VSEPITVLVAEDHPVFRDGLRTLLESVPDFKLVALVSNGEDAVGAARDLQPDVVIMDLRLPGINGIEATRQIVAASPHIRVLVLTMFEDDESVFSAMRAGARGYLLKEADQADVVRAVLSVASGEAVFGPAVAERMLRFFSGSHHPPAAPFPQLTDRERELLALVAKGMNNQAIAELVGISLKTVRNHVSNVFTKLQVADRAQAIVKARQAGLGSHDPFFSG